MSVTTRSSPRPLRLGLVAAVVLAMAATVAAVLARRAEAVTINTNAWYVIVSRHSGKAIDLYNFATNDGAPTLCVKL